MPESDVKEMAKELAKESAKKLTSSFLSIIRGNDKKPSSHPATSSSNTPPPKGHSPGVSDLSGRLNALSLSGPDDTFVGGFSPPVPPQSLTSWPPNNLLYPGGPRGDYSPSFPVPIVGPLPRPSMPMTMQYAVSTSGAGYPRLDGPSASMTTLPPRPSSTSALPPPDFGLSASTKPPSSRSSRPASKSSRSSSTSSNSDAVQCNGITKAGNRCTRVVKGGPALAQVNPDPDIVRFCYQHTKEVLGPSGFYSKKTATIWIKFEDWIPDYLQPDTQAALRTEMSKPPSASDVSGYIYTFEIRDDTPSEVKLKVGRAVNLVKRIDQWGKQCGSKEQVLRGWWPDEEDNAVNESLVKGVVKAGSKGSYCHRLERLVHLELADLSVHAPYLDPHFPKVNKSDATSASPSTGSRARKSAASASLKKQGQPCPDCGQVHKEIFIFQRDERGRYTSREWEKLVKPVIEKWGAFVEAFV